ncbi:hypothetical protein B0H34DRAFT_808905 [Crassisporium funariophilum]|nr:hypothetical protein B0H34DRAFT_808905 [Crassisporium funariophilum]
MASHPPVVFHEPKHARPEEEHPHKHGARLPVIPDLRFEFSYLRSIRPYIEIQKSTPATQPTNVDEVDQALLGGQGYETVDAPGDESEKKEFSSHENTLTSTPAASTPASIPSEIILVNWKKVIWITARDQVMSPLLQGAVWALASYYLTPFSAQLGSRMGTFVRGTIPTKEGLGVGWLRDWVKKLGLSSGTGSEHSSHIQRAR